LAEAVKHHQLRLRQNLLFGVIFQKNCPHDPTRKQSDKDQIEPCQKFRPG
jgi:hypothetical protein